jgi:membrane protein DedA with SNARE-associated domain
MTVTEYLILFVLFAILGAGLPGLGDAALIAAGTLAGEGRVDLGTVLAVSAVAWLLGSLAGYALGIRNGRGLLDHPGRWEKSRRRLLGKGDHAFAGHTFGASVTMPAFVSGIFRVPLGVFVLGAVVAGIGWIGMYVGVSYFFGAEIAARIGQAGTRLLLGVIVIIGVGLGLRFAYSHWRAAQKHRPA